MAKSNDAAFSKTINYASPVREAFQEQGALLRQEGLLL